MACCLTASNHDHSQCWLLISEVLWHSPQSNFTANAPAAIKYNGFENCSFRIIATSPRANELICLSSILCLFWRKYWSLNRYIIFLFGNMTVAPKLWCQSNETGILKVFSNKPWPLISYWGLMDHSGYGLSQWDLKLHCNVFSHWLSPYTEWSLSTKPMIYIPRKQDWQVTSINTQYSSTLSVYTWPITGEM